MSKATELRTKSADEVTKTISTLRSNLAEIRRSHKMGELKNSSKLPSIRKEIARLLTVQRELKTKEKK